VDQNCFSKHGASWALLDLSNGSVHFHFGIQCVGGFTLWTNIAM
jgi:hypothetical protein